VGSYGRGFKRSLFVFDLSDGNALVAYRRDLTRLGWCLGTEIRQEFDALLVKEQ
jgi:hypothetical protein